MADHIPFISSQDSCRLVEKYYSDSQYVRLSLDKVSSLRSKLLPAVKVWIDPAVDGLDNLETRRSKEDKENSWYEFMKKLPGFDRLGSPEFIEKPDVGIVERFVNDLLDLCNEAKPTWITVPQIPIVNDSSRNKVNRILAKATAKWRIGRNYSGKLILPLVFTNQSQVNGKTARNPKVQQAGRCYQDSQADGLWVVDKSLEDDSGSKTLRNTRLPAIIELHQELNDEISSNIRIAGPYWGMNIVLWARNLIDFPAIGVGNSYQYFLAGGHSNPPAAYLAIKPLRRRVGTGRLEEWLDQVLNILGPNNPMYGDLVKMRKNLPLLRAQAQAREQVAKFYKGWFDSIASSPTSGRALALFQDLSAAYACGKPLPDFPDEGVARRPESVVEPLMLNCL